MNKDLLNIKRTISPAKKNKRGIQKKKGVNLKNSIVKTVGFSNSDFFTKEF